MCWVGHKDLLKKQNLKNIYILSCLHGIKFRPNCLQNSRMIPDCEQFNSNFIQQAENYF